MNILYLIKEEPDETGAALIAEHRKDNQVTVVDLAVDKDYNRIIDQIEGCDLVISW